MIRRSGGTTPNGLLVEGRWKTGWSRSSRKLEDNTWARAAAGKFETGGGERVAQGTLAGGPRSARATALRPGKAT